ncbi:MAG: hypothetical protein KIT58_00225 [Planctomycetota bacterium]|nr:hypothetical protein [Planctomycetota bacterium]
MSATSSTWRSGDPHQFGAPTGSKEAFGFLCVVNAERDRPVPVEGYGVCDICVVTGRPLGLIDDLHGL